MQVNRVGFQPRFTAQPRKNNMITFQATPVEILNKLNSVAICDGKRNFIETIATFFGLLEKNLKELMGIPLNLEYKLGGENKIPDGLKELKFDGKTFKQIDEMLSEKNFSCSSSNAHCSCGCNMSKGSYMKELLKMIGVPDPSLIKISTEV